MATEAEPLTSSERQMRARIAAHAKWAQTPDRTAATAAARAARMVQFEDQVDPDRKLNPETRAKLAESARKAYFAKLAYASARARRKKAGKR